MKKNDTPDFDKVFQDVLDYVGAAGQVLDAHNDCPDSNAPKTRIICSLPGGDQVSPYASFPYENEKRWFEVFVSDDNIDVITRFSDPFTNAVAEGFAVIMERKYNGKYST